MTISTTKVQVTFFGNESHLKKLDNKTVKYLDTLLDRNDKLQWNKQIKHIAQKGSYVFIYLFIYLFIYTCLSTSRPEPLQ